MKIKSSGSTLLYIIIIALVVYLLFLRQQGTSGYNNNSNENRLAYKQGVDDFSNGKGMSTTTPYKFKRALVDNRNKKNFYFKPLNQKAEAYKKGYDHAKELAKLKRTTTSSLKNRQTSSQLQRKIDKLVSEMKKRMPVVGTTTTSSSNSIFQITTYRNSPSTFQVSV
jgi:hypothetical protein